MSSNRGTTCDCDGGTVLESGFECCMYCGCVVNRELNSNERAFATCGSPIKPVYTRRRRFTNKIIGALLLRCTVKIDVDLLKSLNHDITKKTTPEMFLKSMSAWRHTPRPYIHIVAYWVAAGENITMPRDEELTLLVRSFDYIFFAWKRLGVTGPMFPYVTLLQHIVESSDFFEASDELCFITRFTKRIRCKRRSEKYLALYKKCVVYVKNGDRFGGFK